jgi:hypothetical protein
MKISKEQAVEAARASGFRIVRFKASSVVVAWKQGQGDKVHVKGFRGNAGKASFYYSFRNRSQAEAYVNDFSARVGGSEERQAARRADLKEKREALKASDHWTVGDVFYCSWGYEQTNVDFYQITHVGKKSVGFRKICQSTAERYHMSGPTQPRRNEFAGEEVRKNLSPCGGIPMKYGSATKWTGKAVWSSWYH